MTFRLIPACPEGFLMGSRGFHPSEEPIHRVIIADDFWMGEIPVTQAQFAIWTKAMGIEHQNHFSGKLDHPAESLTWHQAIDFCDWLTSNYQTQLPPGHRFAELPTEAQWEYACRAGTRMEYYSGDGKFALSKVAWFGEDWDSGSTHPTGKLAPNDFGLYDMHGNVWEWCLDRWDEGAYRRRSDGVEMAEIYQLNEQFGDQGNDGSRVLRGGSWCFSAFWCRAAYRNWFGAGNSDRYFGFRVCLVRSPILKQVSPVAPAEPKR